MSLLLKGGSLLVVGGGACAVPFLKLPVFNRVAPVSASVDQPTGGAV